MTMRTLICPLCWAEINIDQITFNCCQRSLPELWITIFVGSFEVVFHIIEYLHGSAQATVKRPIPKYCHKHRSTSKKAAMGLLLSLVLRTNYDVDVVDVSVNSGPHPETHTYEFKLIG